MNGNKAPEASGFTVLSGIDIAVIGASSKDVTSEAPLLESRDAVFIVAGRAGSFDVGVESSLCSFGTGDSVIVSTRWGRAGSVRLALGFRGVVIVIKTSRFTPQTCDILRSFDVDVNRLEAVLGSIDGCRMLTDYPSVSHVLFEIDAPGSREPSVGYYRLKIIELLRALGNISAAEMTDQAPARSTHADIACKAQQVMMANLEAPKTITAIAQDCGASPTVVKQSFREVFGEPMYQWYRAYRIHAAADLLASDDRVPVAQAAFAVGYSNPSKFAQAFRAVMGQTPSAWRAECGSV